MTLNPIRFLRQWRKIDCIVLSVDKEPEYREFKREGDFIRDVQGSKSYGPIRASVPIRFKKWDLFIVDDETGAVLTLKRSQFQPQGDPTPQEVEIRPSETLWKLHTNPKLLNTLVDVAFATNALSRSPSYMLVWMGILVGGAISWAICASIYS